jgi:hypothetical protein
MADIKQTAEKAAQAFEDGAEWVRDTAHEAQAAIEHVAQKVKAALPGKANGRDHQGEPAVESPL